MFEHFDLPLPVHAEAFGRPRQLSYWNQCNPLFDFFFFLNWFWLNSLFYIEKSALTQTEIVMIIIGG